MPLPSNLAPVGLLVASALFAVAAAVPAAKGGSIDTTFLAFTIVFAILGGVALKKSRGGS